METVRENFKRVEEFGWFLPRECSILPCHRLPGRSSYRNAAVMLLISRGRDGSLQTLMTKRSNKVGTHVGEPCLPGGMQEAGDSGPVATALREAEEEIQLEPSLVEVVAVLPSFPSGWVETITVTPVVCFLRSSMDPEHIKLVPNDEVECAFWVPLSLFVESKHHITIRGSWRGVQVMSHSFNFFEPVAGRTYVIWGLTAAICIIVSAIALGTTPEFPYTSKLIYEILEDSNIAVREVAITSQQIESYSSRGLTAKL